MEIQYLREFLVLNRVRNYQIAADELFITQSTLSKHIMSIEQELGQTLFVRGGRGLALTEFGESFLAHAQTLSEEWQKVQMLAAKQSSSLSVGMLSPANAYGLEEMALWFSEAFPDKTIHMVQDGSQNLINRMTEGEFDLVIVYQMPTTKNVFSCIHLGEDELVAVLPASHPLAGRESIALTEVAGERMLLRPPEYLVRQVVDNAFAREGITPHVVYTSSYTANTIKLLCRGMGITFMMKRATRRFMREDVVMVPLLPAIRLQVNALYPKDRLRTPHFDQTLMWLKAHAEAAHAER